MKNDRLILHSIHTDDGATEIYWARAADDFPGHSPREGFPGYNSVQIDRDEKLLWKGWTDNEIPVSVVIQGNRVRIAITEDMDPGEIEDVFDTATLTYEGPNDMTQGTFGGGVTGVLAIDDDPTGHRPPQV